MSLIRISESDDFFVDYDKDKGMYRVSVFKDNHFQDEYWFDCYEEKEFSKKEIPMRVRREKYFYGTIPYCPVCNNKLTEWASKMLCDNYCRVCGQALDWSEEKKWFNPNEKIPNIGDRIVVQDYSGEEMDIVFNSFPTNINESNVCMWRYAE